MSSIKPENGGNNKYLFLSPTRGRKDIKQDQIQLQQDYSVQEGYSKEIKREREYGNVWKARVQKDQRRRTSNRWLMLKKVQ